MRSVALSLVSFLLLGTYLALSPASAGDQWRTYREPTFGFVYSYPEELFDQTGGDDRPSFHYYESPGSEAKFFVGAWNNEGDTPKSLKRWLKENGEDYGEITYNPGGRSWFVLSGYRGDQIYYQKVMFSCGGRVANIFAIAYPTASRELYDPVVERMEDEFRPARRCS